MSPRYVRWPHLHRLADFAAEKRLKENIALVLALWSIAQGLVLVVDRAAVLRSPSFAIAFDLASPPAWGVLYVLAGAALLATFRTPDRNHTTAWFLRGHVVLNAALAIAFALARMTEGAGLSGVVAYLLPGVLAALLAAVYRNVDEEP